MTDLTNQKCIAIIAAIEYEGELISKELQDAKKTVILGKTVYEGTIGKNNVVVMCCGMGKVSASIGTQALIDRYHPDCIINTGCAGALSPKLGIGDLVLSESVVEWDLDLRAIGFPLGYIDAIGCVEMKADAELCQQIESSIPKEEKVLRGQIASGDQFVSTKAQRENLRENFPNALCAEMEGAAVGHTCLQNNVPFCIVRAMSDTADGDSGIDFARFSNIVSEKSAAWLLNYLKKQ